MKNVRYLGSLPSVLIDLPGSKHVEVERGAVVALPDAVADELSKRGIRIKDEQIVDVDGKKTTIPAEIKPHWEITTDPVTDKPSKE